MISTAEAANFANVGTTTIKRWADQGLLPVVRTAGGHRRFSRGALEKLLRARVRSAGDADPRTTAWLAALIAGQRYEIDTCLLEARSRLGAWSRVADELGGALTVLGRNWAEGTVRVAEEHQASESLARALARIGDMLPTGRGRPTCLLACAADEEHTLGLRLAELCLREQGWTPLWLGGRTPVVEVIQQARSGQVAMVALSASAANCDAGTLRFIADTIGQGCKKLGTLLVLGGAGAWPTTPSYGVRLNSFSDFHELLVANSS